MRRARKEHQGSPEGHPATPTKWSGPWAVFVTATSLFFVLALTSILSPRGLTYDEPLHLLGTRMLVAGASLGDVLHAPLPSAAGPLYPVLHWMLYPLTGFNPHLLRVVNLVLLGVAIVFEGLTLRALKVVNALPLALATTALPVVWASAGLALTEVPAITMMSVAVYFGAQALRHLNDGPAAILPRAVLAAVFFSLAVLGRQVYLALIVFPLAGALLDRRLRIAVLCFLPIALTAPVLVFVTWGGLVPKSVRSIVGSVGSGSLSDVLLAIAYLAVCVAILAPSWFASLRAWRVPALVAVLAGAVNFLVIRLQFAPLGLIQRHIPSPFRTSYLLIGGSVVVAICAVFLIASYSNIRTRVNDLQFVLTSGSTAIMIATIAGIGEFSSRYVVTALPFLVLMLYPYFRANRVTALRMMVGGAIGFVSLASYLYF